MAFHHVLITFIDSPNKPRCVLSDLSEQQLQTQFVTPYGKGKDILCGTEVIRVGSIKSVQIVCTSKKSEVERSAIQEKSFKEIQEFNRQSDSVTLISPGYGYEPEDIAEAGVDVTSQYIIGPPGHAASGGFVELLNNQWVVAVGTGLIVAVLVWWFGWS
jgi:hypothetical protein